MVVWVQSFGMRCELCGEVAMGQVILGIHRFPLSVIPPIPHIHIHSSVTRVQENGSINTAVPQRPSLAPVRINKIFSNLCAPLSGSPARVENSLRCCGNITQGIAYFLFLFNVVQCDVSWSYDVANFILVIVQRDATICMLYLIAISLYIFRVPSTPIIRST